MTEHVVIAAIIGLPLLLGLFLRVSTSHIFFSIMAGELLGRYFGHDIDKQAGDLSTPVATQGYGEVVLLTVPMIITSVILKGGVSKGKILLHIIPLLITGLIFAAFLLPVLPAEAQSILSASSIGQKILELNKIIIGTMIVLQLVSLWLFNRHEHGKNKHKS